jgi:hypothetical protein
MCSAPISPPATSTRVEPPWPPPGAHAHWLVRSSRVGGNTGGATSPLPISPERRKQLDFVHACSAKTGLEAEPTSAGGSVTSVPPWPSLESVKLLVAYWPSSVRLAVCVPSLTVSDPLRLLPTSVKDSIVPLPKATSHKSISVTPKGEPKPPIKPWKLTAASS